MLQQITQSGFVFLLLGLMALVPTDLLLIGLDNITDGDLMTIAMEIEMESDIDSEDKEETKEKNKKKNKITVNNLNIVFGFSNLNPLVSQTDKETFGHPLAHHLEVLTPPPEII